MSKAKPSKLNVLFIGNSFTARNNLPGMIAAMAESRGMGLAYRLLSIGGASLRTHWNKGEAAEAIRTGAYDYVVLQEQSTLPVKNAARMHENIRLFDDIIKGSGAKTALYLTWARQHTPEAQEAITKAYTSIGSELGVVVIPVGVAWQKFLAKHKRPVLHDKDKSHPTLAGSYLAACVFVAILFGQTPVGTEIGVDRLGQADMKLLQRAAADAVAAHLC